MNVQAQESKMYYVTMIRDRVGTARLAGPYATHDEALQLVDKVRNIAYNVDPRSHWDSFGTCGVTSAEHKSGVLNNHITQGNKS